MEKKLAIDLTSAEVVARLIKDTESGMYSTTDSDGNQVVAFIAQGKGMDLRTYQGNGWVRVDSYDENGIWEGDTFDGRWEEGKYNLVDGVALNKLHPDTFEIPTKNDISSLSLGMYVKLGFSEYEKIPERMWVEIDSINGKKFTGKLNNEPHVLESIKLGDVVEFEAKNILAIFED
ncbi:TPA: DUF2314 domain-containing protein [Bacillus cereus]|nr:DUF2314 domain-containing protein [Bacillus cereus]